jgi:hypothetical protein
VKPTRAARLLPALLAAAGLGCATSVRVAFDPAEDFSAYRTWAWLPRGFEVPASRSRVSPELDALLRGAVERELAARGYVRAAEEPPDFLVTYHLRIELEIFHGIETPAMETVSSYHREGSFEVTASRPVTQFYERGTLVLDVADGRERQLVWRGIGIRRVRNSFRSRAEAVVADIFEAFPPDPGS